YVKISFPYVKSSAYVNELDVFSRHGSTWIRSGLLVPCLRSGCTSGRDNGLLHERRFIMQDIEEKGLEFYSHLQELGCGPLVKDPCKVNKDWVRDFYANLPTVAWSPDEPVDYVRGMQIILTQDTINEALGRPNPPKDTLKAQDVDGNGQ
ncbi:hypothetical protein HAX54_050613, partial [Datura stramonium]|nr:hypothetical protein [Datura stramonium]